MGHLRTILYGYVKFSKITEGNGMKNCIVPVLKRSQNKPSVDNLSHSDTEEAINSLFTYVYLT